MPNEQKTNTEPAKGYGTKDAPLDIQQARDTIRQDFLKFAGLVMGHVQLPEGHGFANHAAFQLEHQLKWYLGCEIKSSDAGLSIYGHRTELDDSDTSQIRVEVRYFHPELHFRDGRKKPQVSRQYNNGFSAHLWVSQGRPFWGMHKSLIDGSEFCRDCETVEDLAQIVIQRLTVALALRTPAGQSFHKNSSQTEMAHS